MEKGRACVPDLAGGFNIFFSLPEALFSRIVGCVLFVVAIRILL